jgi:hypothetical protein
MKALRQGSLDGLCGLYAIINALDPAGLKIRRGQLHADLFKELAYSLGSVALLSAMREGLHRQDLIRAAHGAFRWLELEHGHSFAMDTPFANRRFKTARTFLAALEDALETPDQGVIIYVAMPRRDHWTVATGITGQILTLRDSDGLTSLPIPQLMDPESAFGIAPAETLIVRQLQPQSLL